MITVQEHSATLDGSTRTQNGEPSFLTSWRARVRPDSDVRYIISTTRPWSCNRWPMAVEYSLEGKKKRQVTSQIKEYWEKERERCATVLCCCYSAWNEETSEYRSSRVKQGGIALTATGIQQILSKWQEGFVEGALTIWQWCMRTRGSQGINGFETSQRSPSWSACVKSRRDF